ncbi:MAG TPA: DNA polymerase III subunit delta [Spirochaetales bacterium]|nr:DNA polymerase III subunit delta [Spirochaetales bacterium]HRY55028.1 DNA polymerase III subunit delta [Spirochaetia bacterium]
MRLESAYLLAGPEAGKRAAFVDELRAAVKAADGAAAEEHRLYAYESGVGELLALLRNGSLFASRRLVEYRFAELVKGKEDLGELAAYLASPAPDAILLLETDQFYVEKALEEAVGKARKQTFFEMFESEKPRWVERRLRALGLEPEDSGVEALLELVENESSALDAACSRLALVLPRGASVGEAEVEAAIARNRQEDAFSLFDRLATGELEEALETLDAVLSDRRGDAVQVISALTWSFRRLVKLHLLLESGESFEAACMKHQLRSKAAQRQNGAALKRYSRAECERIVRLASDFDARSRSLGSAYERTLLQLLAYGILVKKGRLEAAPPAASPLD